MATFRLVSRAQSAIVTHEFSSYNEAAAFIKRSMSPAAAGVVRPYRKNPAQASSVWAVSYVNPELSTGAQYVRLDHWEKPFPSYCD